MTFLAKVIILTLVSTAVAVPGALKKNPGLDEYATFEDAKVIETPIAEAPVAKYNGIYWQGMSLGSVSDDEDVPLIQGVFPGVVPRSMPNYAAFSPKEVATLLEGTPRMTVNYKKSTFKSFNPENFWFGCALGTVEGETSVPETCDLTIKGYNLMWKMIARKTFEFTGKVLRRNMVQAVTTGFNGLQYAEFYLSAAEGTAALIDSVSYKLFK